MNKKLVNVVIETNGLKNSYINHFINFINDMTDFNYFGIKIKDDDIIIEEIDVKYVNTIVYTLLFDEVNTYLNYDIIKSINTKPL